MIIYSETKSRFREDVFSNKIESVILDLFKTKAKRSVGKSEVNSWKNSMQYMDRVLEDDEIPEDSKVSIEYTLPRSAKRIDFILSGRNAKDEESVVIVELKQWSEMESTQKDAIVRTYLGGRKVETEHPSYQAWTYAALLEDYNQTVQEEGIGLFPCAYLHNCVSDRIVRSSFYGEHLKKAPVFIKDDAQALRDFIKLHVKYGDSGDVMYRIDKGKIRPSKNLADSLVAMLQGNREFLMIDDQKLVYETALKLAGDSQAGGKQVLIVEGGPGTGKSVVAINLLVELTKRELVAQYVSKNAAPRAVYESKLTGTYTKTRIANLFKGSGAFMDATPDDIDVLIVDEAHRLNEKSGLYQNLGENQISELISAAKLSIFFLDEDQRVTLKDIGEKAEIRRFAEASGATIHELELQSQFRCNGSDGYLAWVDHALQIRETANSTLSDIDYEFRVCDSASELRDEIFEKNRERNSARLVAGYCWKWASKKDPTAMDIEFPGTDFAMQWNLTADGSLWIVKPESVKEVGCIHTCQGLDLDYVGVIIGDDFVVRNGVAKVDATKRAQHDRTVFGYKKLLKEQPAVALSKAELIIKNTYRTLMTRGLKGCFVYCTDQETNDYFRSFGESLAASPHAPPSRFEGLRLRVLSSGEVSPYQNAVPIFEELSTIRELNTYRGADDCDWVELPSAFVPMPGHFVARMVGESMNRRIPNGAWCLFGPPNHESSERRVALLHHEEIQDLDTVGHCSVRVYEPAAVVDGADTRTSDGVVLSPDSNVVGYSTVRLSGSGADELRVVGELVAVLG